MMRCPACGHEVVAAPFCQRCGKPMRSPEVNPPDSKPAVMSSPVSSAPPSHATKPNDTPSAAFAAHAARNAGSAAVPPRHSRWRNAIWAVFVVLLYLAVADVAIEALLQDSPLCWWLAAGAAFYFALCAVVWLLAPKIWRRVGWASRAVISLVVLLAAIAVSARMTGGLRMFGQRFPVLGVKAGEPGLNQPSDVASPAASASASASDFSQLSPQQKIAKLQHHIDVAERWKTAITNYASSVPASLTDAAALSDALTTPQAVFEYVRDRIGLEPYPGAMKGVAATLITSGGNALDRSLLLATVLSIKGIDVQIAHGQLAPAQAQNLLQQITNKPNAAELIASSMHPSPSGSAATPAAQKTDAFVAASLQRLADTVEQNFSLLDTSIKAAKITVGSDNSAALSKILQDHYWVRATVDGKTIDLDSSFAAAQWGQKFADPSETFSTGTIDSSHFQQVTLRLVADYLNAGAKTSQTLFSSDFNAMDLWGKNIRLAVLPNEAKASPNTFHATLAVGDNTVAQQSFQLRVTQSAKKDVPQAQGGLLGGIIGATGGTTGQPSASAPVGAVLARLYLEFETRAPQLSPKQSRRIILDRLASNGGSLQIDPALAKDDVAGKLLVQIWDGAIAVGTIHPAYLATATAAWIDAYESLQNALIAAENAGGKLNPQDLPRSLLPPELLTFFVASGEAEDQIQKKFAPAARAYYERPRLAFFRHGFVVADWGDLSKPASYREGIDVVNSPLGFIGAPDAQRGLAMRWGAADTALELRFSLAGGEGFNTIRLMAAATSQKVAVRAVSPNQKAAPQSMNVPFSIKSVLDSEVSDNRALLAPASLVNLNGTRTYGWWSIEQSTGYAIGKMELGGAQDLSEYTEVQQKIPEWSKLAGTLLGNVLRCYAASEASALATGQGTGTSQCLEAACCQGFSEVLGMEAEGGMSMALIREEEEDLNALQQAIESAEKSGLGSAAGAGAGAAGKAVCEGGGG
jgi:hypothetical protein